MQLHPQALNKSPSLSKSTLRATINKAAIKTGELRLNGVIGNDWFGDGITAKKFVKELSALGAVTTLNLYITSEGGSVTEARAMYSELNRHKAKINVIIDGIAASAATFLAMAGDTITIGEGDLFMIHNARMGVGGDYREHQKAADLLASIDDVIRGHYSSRTGISDKQLRNWMDEEKWFTGTEAKSHGFATALVSNKGPSTNCVRVVPWIENAPKDFRPRRAAALNLLSGK